MIDINEAVERASVRETDDLQRVGALLLVRYCSFYQDPKFSPWFEQSRMALASVVEAARSILSQGGGSIDLEEIKDSLSEVLEGSDPDGPPFETEIFDHLVFADEVLEFLQTPNRPALLSRAFEHAEELAEAHEEMGRAEYPSSDWEPAELAAMEADARTRDMQEDFGGAVALTRSEEFAQAYAEVIEKCYTAEDAGSGA
ncbi:hypothetical protein [Streptomyces spongiae]|uniref:DUF4375 domain-containing protein n=1 Tax=Streptomyces spongiae TaxID=565072 RepID=A0A5N8XC96_9ACTN|nr:hypothetical protein [Streptomyces spongiae]MPY56804.1 hypothetical protein [Streptomyces spongiae]